MERKPVAIIGVGNYLMGDEGAGIHAIESLRQLNWPDGVELIDAGTPGVGLLHIIEGRRLAVIIDCADFDGKPGEICELDPDKLKNDEKAEISLHATDLLTALSLAKSTGNYPERAVIIGIQPKEIAMGMKLSAEVFAAFARLPALIRQIIA